MTTQTSTRLRLDALPMGTPVVLEFQGNGYSYEEGALFLGVYGEGDERRAHFSSMSPQHITRQGVEARGAHEWDAYRYAGRWCYGSSAQVVRLVAALEVTA